MRLLPAALHGGILPFKRCCQRALSVSNTLRILQLFMYSLWSIIESGAQLFKLPPSGLFYSCTQILMGYYVIPRTAEDPLEMVVNPQGLDVRTKARAAAVAVGRAPALVVLSSCCVQLLGTASGPFLTGRLCSLFGHAWSQAAYAPWTLQFSSPSYPSTAEACVERWRLPL